MSLISVSKAAKLFNVSRPTLQKALRDGTITGEKVTSGGSESWQIDTAELARLYALRDPSPANMARQDEGSGQSLAKENSGDIEGLSGEVIRALESRLQTAQAELDALRAGKANAEQELAASQAVAEERRRILDDMMKLLPKPKDHPVRRGLWSRLFSSR
ncbi:hypothetical protein E4191_15935 (plasmid) [Paracoccus liaowanqingii]|uniref:HTH psq-type domain-containing protein n=1 Tax=Paracoccus liaowanqingii TaxID=2560053 RepID=A0A4Y5SSH9_9RHOB|nr:helix-turn-helix domain-containing protein [Paracoccus liaowanqingii]QDA35664.1 hypothetical protein E4191_15935 [Paracoccus liaowanqingii]